MASPDDIKALRQLHTALETHAASHNIEIQNLQFMPESLNVKVGDMITWTNRDIAPHTATALDKSWDIGTLKKDESKSLQVAENMAGDYVCRFHPVMKGKITIES